MVKLIKITSLDQIKVGDVLSDGEYRYKVWAKPDLLVALKQLDIRGVMPSWFNLDELNDYGYQLEVEDTPWQPMEGENYYTPYIHWGDADHYCWHVGRGRQINQDHIAAGMCFRTPEEATAAAQKMLDAIKPN